MGQPASFSLVFFLYGPGKSLCVAGRFLQECVKDAPCRFPVVAGMNPFAIIPLIGTASALGGLTSYGAGRLIFHIPLVRKLTGAAYSKWGKYIRRYGFPFVLAAGILPLPFSTICVAAGALKMDIRRILICCSMRYIRTAIYFTFFRIGLMAFA